MPGTGIDKLRNVAILAHGGAGKTSVTEALLFNVKAITRMGKVEDGNTASDYEPEEVKRSGSIQTSLVPCEWNGFKVNFLDTPGYDDFVSELVSAIRVVEGAVIVVAAPSGVELGTERAWGRCEELGIPRIFFINKMDRENADFHRSLDGIQAKFGRKCVPLFLPVGSQQSFKGVVSLLRPLSDVPDEVASEAGSARERLIEAVAESDDDLATKYLEGEELTEQEIVTGVRKAILSGEIVPVLSGSATVNQGVQELLEAVVNYLPSPQDAGPVEASKSGSSSKEEINPDPNGPLAAFVFKTLADPFVGKLSIFRVYRGTFRSNTEVWNEGKGQSERVGLMYSLRGKNQEQVPEIGPGDIGAVSKLAVTVTNDTLCVKDHAVAFPPIEFPVGYYSSAVYPKTKADVDKMSMALSRVVEEDPGMRLVRDSETKETVLQGLGDSHLEVTVEKARRKFGVDLALQLPKVPYKETITGVARTEYKHKKQSGGHGQYGHVLLRLEPRERGQGFDFGSEVVGGSVPREYIPWVEKGVVKALQDGAVAGYPVVDLRAVLYDGSYHDVDSSGICFEIAGSHALKMGMAEANALLLEPIMKLTVTVPDNFTGDVIGDLNGKRGRIVGMNPQGGVTAIEADVPQAELLRYATDLRSMTQGRGTYTMEFDHYEEVPAHITQKIAEEAKKVKEAAKA